MNTPENTNVNNVNYPNLFDEPVPSAPQQQDISLHLEQANPDINALILKTAQFSQQLTRYPYTYGNRSHNQLLKTRNDYTVSEPSDGDHATNSTHVNVTITDISLCSIL
jgi:hypothetical protein